MKWQSNNGQYGSIYGNNGNRGWDFTWDFSKGSIDFFGFHRILKGFHRD
jgi:hypothetical protein